MSGELPSQQRQGEDERPSPRAADVPQTTAPTNVTISNSTFTAPSVGSISGNMGQVQLISNHYHGQDGRPQDTADANRSVHTPLLLGERDLPNHFVQREAVDTPLLQWMQARASGSGKAPYVYAIVGMPAVGKTTAAINAAHKALNVGFSTVVWTNAGMESLEKVLGDLVSKMKPNEDTTGWKKERLKYEITEQCKRWKRDHPDKRVLLVLDDLNDNNVFSHVKCFDAIIVTSKKAVCGKHESITTQMFRIPDGLNRDEVMQMLEAVMDKELFDSVKDEHLLSPVIEICDENYNIPLGIKMIANSLVRNADELLKHKTNYLENLRTHIRHKMIISKGKAQRGLPEDDDYKYHSVVAALAYYIEQLDEDERQLYRQLAIFPQGCEIFPTTMARIWSYRHETMTTEESKDQLRSFCDQSLLAGHWDDAIGQYAFALHDLQVETLKEMANSPGEIANFKRDVVDSYKDNIDGVLEGAEVDKYFYEQYISLCMDVGDVDCAVSCLCSLRYLVARTRAGLADGCLTDFEKTKRATERTRLESYFQFIKDSLASAVAQKDHLVLIRLGLLRPHDEDIFVDAESIAKQMTDETFLCPKDSPQWESDGAMPWLYEFGVRKEYIDDLADITSISVDDTGQWALFGCTTGTVLLYELSSGKALTVAELRQEIVFVKFLSCKMPRACLVVTEHAVHVLTARRQREGQFPMKLQREKELPFENETIQDAGCEGGRVWLLTSSRTTSQNDQNDQVTFRTSCYVVDDNFDFSLKQRFKVQSEHDRISVSRCGKTAIVSAIDTVAEMFSLEPESSHNLPEKGEIVGFFLDGQHLLMITQRQINLKDSLALLFNESSGDSASDRSTNLQTAQETISRLKRTNEMSDESYAEQVGEVLSSISSSVDSTALNDLLPHLRNNQSSREIEEYMTQCCESALPSIVENKTLVRDMVSLLADMNVRGPAMNPRQNQMTNSWQPSCSSPSLIGVSAVPRLANLSLHLGHLVLRSFTDQRRRISRYLPLHVDLVIVDRRSLSPVRRIPFSAPCGISLFESSFAILDNPCRVFHIAGGEELKEIHLMDFDSRQQYRPIIVGDKVFSRRLDNRIAVYQLRTGSQEESPQRPAITDALTGTKIANEPRSRCITCIEWTERLDDFVAVFSEDNRLNAKLLLRNEVFISIDDFPSVCSVGPREVVVAARESPVVTRFPISREMRFEPTPLAFDPDDKICSVCHSWGRGDLIVAVEDVSDSCQLWRIVDDRPQRMFGIGRRPDDMRVCDSSGSVLCWCSKESQLSPRLTVWSSADASPALKEECRCYQISLDRRRVAVVSHSEEVIVWDLQSRREVFRSAGGCVLSLQLSPDGGQLHWLKSADLFSRRVLCTTRVAQSSEEMTPMREMGELAFSDDLAPTLVKVSDECRALFVDGRGIHEGNFVTKKQTPVIGWKWFNYSALNDRPHVLACPSRDVIVIVNRFNEVFTLRSCKSGT